MIRWFKSLFAWRDVRYTGVWLYQENRVTGRRIACRVGRCYQPLDFDWLAAGPGDGKVYDSLHYRGGFSVPSAA